MRVRRPRRSDLELGLPRIFAGPPLEPVRYRPSWLQRLFGIRWDEPPRRDRERDEKR